MKKKSPWGIFLVLVIISIPCFYAARIYPSLPQTIPTHFGIDGKANGFSDKNSLWLILLVMSAVSFGVYSIVTNLNKIDPKKAAGQSPDMYHKIGIVMVIFISAISIVILYSSANGSISINKLLLPLMGLFFAVLGNYMHSIKPNYFVGFRLPWTLENEDNWRKTHQLVGKIWVPGGLLITLCTLLLPASTAFVAFMVITLILVLIPGIYSYRYYKTHQNN